MGACGSCGVRDKLEVQLGVPESPKRRREPKLRVWSRAGDLVLELSRRQAAGLQGLDIKELILQAAGLEGEPQLTLVAGNSILQDGDDVEALWELRSQLEVFFLIELPWCSELPVIYPDFMKEVSETELCIPAAPLEQLRFSLHVLCAGYPTFTAARREDGSIHISHHSSEGGGKLLVSISRACELLGPSDQHLGAIVDGSDGQYSLHGSGCQILALEANWEAWQLAIFSMADGSAVEHATVARRLEGALGAEHYELRVEPMVDSVLMLACFFAVVVLRLAPLSGGAGWIRAADL